MKTTTIVIFVDGFGGMAVTDHTKTHAEIIQELNRESVWEVLDGMQKLPRGTHEVTLSFEWESGCYEYPDPEFVVTVTGSEPVVNAR